MRPLLFFSYLFLAFSDAPSERLSPVWRIDCDERATVSLSALPGFVAAVRAIHLLMDSPLSGAREGGRCPSVGSASVPS